MLDISVGQDVVIGNDKSVTMGVAEARSTNHENPRIC